MGALTGIRIIEIAGIGPGPFAAMMLADMGADLICVQRPGGGMFSGGRLDFLNRGKRSVCLNLKTPQGVEALLRLLDDAGGLVEGFRPGVMEKLGLGPEECLARKPSLIYGRMTGWGQEGPLAHSAGHDINYIALGGALYHIGRRGEAPTIPLNLVGDFGGGGMLLAFGMVCALLEAQRSGKGQVVDAAMIDGVALLMISLMGAYQAGAWSDERGANFLDSGLPFYNVYECSDGEYISIGALEPQFYQELVERLGGQLPEQGDEARRPQLEQRLREIFKSRSRDEWCAQLEGSDACFAPLLRMSELRQHPHHQARGSFREEDGVWEPLPAPRLSRTPGAAGHPPEKPGQHTEEVLQEAGFSAEEIRKLRQ